MTEDPMAMEDDVFVVTWFKMRDDECAQYPGGYERYRRLTAHSLRAEDAPSFSDGQCGSSSPAVTLHDAPVLLKSAAELLCRQFVPIRYLIPGLLPEGLTVLAARPKIGKSWLALDIAIACATGGRVLGRQVEQGDVLYLALEDSDRRMHSRLSKLQASGQGLGNLQYATQWPRGEAGAAAIQDWIGAHPQARLVVIDVFTKLRPNLDGKATSSAYTIDYNDIARLKPPADRGVSILLVHHTRKADSEDPVDAISGTLGLGGAADGVWIIKRGRGQGEAELHLVGRDLEEEGAFAIRFDRETCRWHWVGEAWRVRISEERREIIDSLAAGPAGPGELAKRIGKKENAVRYLLHQMMKDYQVAHGLDGRYRALESEPMALDDSPTLSP